MCSDSGFNIWMEEVDQLLIEELCVSSADLEDRCYRDAYDDGVSPREMVNEIIQEVL